MTQQPSATFPILSPQEIAESSRSFGCSLTVDDILHPVPGKIQHAYEWWLITIFDLTIVDCVRAAEDKLDSLECEYPEAFREPLIHSLFIDTINQLMRCACIDDFQLTDLVAPTPARVRRILSAFINFYLFEREQAAEHYIPMLNKLEELAAKEADLSRSNDELRARVNGIHAKRKAEEEEVERIRQTIREKQEAMRLMKSENNVLQEARDAAKHETSKAAHEAAALATQLKQQEIENIRLQGRLIQSPDRVKSTIADLGARIARETDTLRSIEGKTSEMKETIETLERWDAELLGALKIMDEWELEKQKHKQASVEYEDKRTRLDELEGTTNELSDALENLGIRLANTEAELKRHTAKSERKRDELRRAQKTLNEALAGLLEEKRMMDHEAAAKEREANEVEAEIRALHESCIDELRRGEEAYANLVSSVHTYSAHLNTILDRINSDMMAPVNFE